MNDPWMAVGLGNPGKQYARTRHNAGARAVELLAARLGVKLRASKQACLVADARTGEEKILLARPTTFMNESGRAVGALIKWYKVPIDQLIVLHDDIDLTTAALRLKKGGGTAGHHGLDSIVSAIESRDFYRVRIGVGRTRIPETPDRLLESIPKQESEALAAAEAEAAEAVLSIVHEGLDRAMNKFNRNL